MTPNDTILNDRLERGLAELGLDVAADRRERLVALVGLLHKWNRAYNLTAVRDPEEMVARHVLDSAAVLPFVTGPSLLDVGAGRACRGWCWRFSRPSSTSRCSTATARRCASSVRR